MAGGKASGGGCDCGIAVPTATPHCFACPMLLGSTLVTGKHNNLKINLLLHVFFED